MICWHSTRLVSARTRTEHAILRSNLSWTSCFWRKIAFRTITNGPSRIYEPSHLDIPLRNPEHNIYVSSSTDPFFNLTLEDWCVSWPCIDQVPDPSMSKTCGAKNTLYFSVLLWPVCGVSVFNCCVIDRLFQHSPSSSPLLLIYRDSPCVIIGRHQNPWTEVNFHALRAARIPFIRRRSGGGTVYHVS